MVTKPTMFQEAALAYRQRLRAEGRLGPDTDRRIFALEVAFRGVALCDITPRKIQDYFATRYVGASPGTVNRNMNVLSAILGVAAEEGLVLTKPRVKRWKHSDAREVHLELDEVMPVVNWVRDNRGLLAGFCILLLIDTGMRFGEMLRLRWGDLQEDWITVRKGKSGKTIARKVPTSPRLLEYMVENAILPTFEDGHEVLVVASRWSENPTTIGRALNVFLREACNAVNARCKEDVRVHDLRHTFAFLCASAGADLADIKELMGHSTINMTMRYRGFVKTRAADVIRRGMAAGAKVPAELKGGLGYATGR